MFQYILIYLSCGVLFNLLYDLLIYALGEEHEDKRFDIVERIITTIIWPIPLIRFITGFLKSL